MLEVMNAREKKLYCVLITVWTFVNIVFWSWWFQGEHVSSLPMFVAMSVSLFYETTILPSFYLFFVGKMRKPEVIDPEPGLRVAMITLCVPHKESIKVIKMSSTQFFEQIFSV